jgi:hypothetical protein
VLHMGSRRIVAAYVEDVVGLEVRRRRLEGGTAVAAGRVEAGTAVPAAGEDSSVPEETGSALGSFHRGEGRSIAVALVLGLVRSAVGVVAEEWQGAKWARWSCKRTRRRGSIA